ncbi:uncharacterized protein Bfra_008688 [Botrytis fragariae]|uniref:Uncharacterized protein n=1 Tax=Botrytis fragariae TaxID=1964551 RepID=A0A8H6EH36_9HELO|nr:uncharacterized protein Bfra_008688 [Botrytis fragariae]KAF5871665.1 hypothetical protein Bfra_008688 [Botrytis fragariae]
MFSRRRWDASMTTMLFGTSEDMVFKLLLIDVAAAVHVLKGKKKDVRTGSSQIQRCGDTRGLGIEARLDSEVAGDRISQSKPIIMQISGMVCVVKDLA